MEQRPFDALVFGEACSEQKGILCQISCLQSPLNRNEILRVRGRGRGRRGERGKEREREREKEREREREKERERERDINKIKFAI